MDSLSPSLLKSLNLTDDQAAVYVAALELGQTTMLGLAKKSGVNRTKIYRFIDELKNRQLMTETRKRKRNLYSGVHPEQLVEITKETTRELENALPELLAIYNRSRTKPKVTFYEDVEGMKEVYADTLKERKEIVGWSDYEYSFKVMRNYLTHYPEERVKRNIFYKVIARENPESRRLQKIGLKELREVRITPSGDQQTELYVYGNKVAHLSFRSNPVFAVIIEDPAIASTMRQIWKEAWSKLPEAIVPTEATEGID